VLLKIYNRNVAGWVLGLFNAHPKDAVNGPTPIHGSAGLADIPGAVDDEFIVYAHSTGVCVRVSRHTVLPVSLVEGGYEVITFSRLQHGFAAIGLIDHFNSGGAIVSHAVEPGRLEVELIDGGRFAVFSNVRPHQVLVNGRQVPFQYPESDGLVVVDVERGTHNSTITLHTEL
jgi:hypothetical protein